MSTGLDTDDVTKLTIYHDGQGTALLRLRSAVAEQFLVRELGKVTGQGAAVGLHKGDECVSSLTISPVNKEILTNMDNSEAQVESEVSYCSFVSDADCHTIYHITHSNDCHST